MDESRYSRNEGLFGRAGQELIGVTTVAIVGLGGLGAPLAQQLAYLGVRDYRLIDGDAVGDSSLNRLVGATAADLGLPKVHVAARTIAAVQPGALIEKVPEKVETDAGRGALSGADVAFGCVDDDLARVALTKACVAAGVPFFDLATDIHAPEDEEPTYGGRVMFSGQAERCPRCLDLLDERRLRIPFLNQAEREAFEKEYGISVEALEGTGPSVISLNSVVASLAVTEFMVWRTGLREPATLLNYAAYQGGGVRASADAPTPSCQHCSRG